jgi:hypothetical protein
MALGGLLGEPVAVFLAGLYSFPAFAASWTVEGRVN